MRIYLTRTKYMRWRDSFKSAAQCEREGIAKDETADNMPMVVAKDGGDGENIKPFMHETRRRLVRLEDRLAIQTKLLFLMLATILTGIGAGLVVAFVFA